MQIRNSAQMQIIIHGIKGTVKDQGGLVEIVPHGKQIESSGKQEERTIYSII